MLSSTGSSFILDTLVSKKLRKGIYKDSPDNGLYKDTTGTDYMTTLNTGTTNYIKASSLK